MCRSIAEGGQRCAAHTRPRYEAATFGTAEWDEAAGEYAATPEGRKALTGEMYRSYGYNNPERIAAFEQAIKRGETLRRIAGEAAIESARAAGRLRPVHVAQNTVWGDWVVDCGASGPQRDDGLPRWSVENIDSRDSAERIARHHLTITRLTNDYARAQERNPCADSTRYRVKEHPDGSMTVYHHGMEPGDPVGTIHPDGTYTTAPHLPRRIGDHHTPERDMGPFYTRL